MKHMTNIVNKIGERFIELCLKVMSRKGAIFITATILLAKGAISGEIWFWTTAVIVLDMGGMKIAEMYRQGAWDK